MPVKSTPAKSSAPAKQPAKEPEKAPVAPPPEPPQAEPAVSKGAVTIAEEPQQGLTKAQETGSQEVTTYDDPFESAAGAGLENVTSRDILIPRITILQKSSPEIEEGHAKQIKGAKFGDIADVGMSEIFESPLHFLAVFYEKKWLEWPPRGTKNQRMKVHDTDEILAECKPDAKGKMFLGPNLIQETAQFYGLNISAGFRRNFIPMASTQLKPAAQWTTWATGEKEKRKDGSSFVPPLFFRSYYLSTVKAENADGTWALWKIERGETLRELCSTPQELKSIFDECMKFRELLIKRQVQGDFGEVDADEAAGGAQHSDSSKM